MDADAKRKKVLQYINIIFLVPHAKQFSIVDSPGRGRVSKALARTRHAHHFDGYNVHVAAVFDRLAKIKIISNFQIMVAQDLNSK